MKIVCSMVYVLDSTIFYYIQHSVDLKLYVKILHISSCASMIIASSGGDLSTILMQFQCLQLWGYRTYLDCKSKPWSTIASLAKYFPAGRRSLSGQLLMRERSPGVGVNGDRLLRDTQATSQWQIVRVELDIWLAVFAIFFELPSGRMRNLHMTSN